MTVGTPSLHPQYNVEEEGFDVELFTQEWQCQGHWQNARKGKKLYFKHLKQADEYSFYGEINILNGHTESKEAWLAHSRVKSFKVYLDKHFIGKLIVPDKAAVSIHINQLLPKGFLRDELLNTEFGKVDICLEIDELYGQGAPEDSALDCYVHCSP
ncbi:MAG: hypothetical protein GY810_12920 [Aureispira sp.]|nr:hypothetical protein [Aureispira sp.]